MAIAQLPIAGTLQGAIAELMRAWIPLLRAATIPWIFVVLASLVMELGTQPDPADPVGSAFKIMMAAFVCGLVGGVAAILIAVSCHRIVLLGRRALAGDWGVYWSDREVAFLGRALVLGLLQFIPMFGASLLLGYAALEPYQYLNAAFAMGLILAYPIARLSLVLPAIAIDERITFAESWRLSSGNGRRLAIVLLPAPLLLHGLTMVHLALLPDQSFALTAAQSLLVPVVGIFEIATLSVSFRTLRGQAFDRGEPAEVQAASA